MPLYNLPTRGDTAHDAVDAGNPIKTGGKALSALPTAVTANDRVNAYFDTFGIQQVALRDAAGAAIATGVQYVEDTALAADAGQGTLVVTRRDDALSTLTPAEGDATGLRSNNRGALWIVHDGAVSLAALPAGTNNIGDVDVLTLPASTNTIEVVGDVAEDAALAGNPQRIGFRASTAIPTAMSADNDIVTPWANRSGAPVVTQAPHVGLNSDPWALANKTAQYTTTQTSAVLQAGGASEKIVVTQIQIQVGGTTAGTLQVYFGTGAYSRGTSRAIFDGEFAPSATLKPGVVMTGPFISGANGDDVLVTTSAAINPLTISVWYYVVV